MLGSFTDRELKIYELVLKRFLAVLLPPYLYEQTTINAIVNQEIFTVSGKIETQIGWKEVYGHEEDSEDQTLPSLKQNQFLPITEMVKQPHQVILMKQPYYQQWKIQFVIQKTLRNN